MKRIASSQIKWRLLFTVAGFLAFGLVGVAFGLDPFVWEDYFPLNSTVTVEATTVEIDQLGGDPVGPYITARITRGPLVSGAFNMSAEVRTERSNLTQIRLMSASDSNSNGTIDSGEWTVHATATPSKVGSEWIATTLTVSVPAGRDVYRVEHTWSGWGTSYDDFRLSGVTVP